MSELPEGPKKYTCSECDHLTMEPLSAVNPFDSQDTITGCPNCKQAESLKVACMALGCQREASSGTPGGWGYRYAWLCWKHYYDEWRKTKEGEAREERRRDGW